jgi:hypothetical protein
LFVHCVGEVCRIDRLRVAKLTWNCGRWNGEEEFVLCSSRRLSSSALAR